MNSGGSAGGRGRRGGRAAQSGDVERETELEDWAGIGLGGVEGELESVGCEALEILGDSPRELASGLVDALSNGLSDLKG